METTLGMQIPFKVNGPFKCRSRVGNGRYEMTGPGSDGVSGREVDEENSFLQGNLNCPNIVVILPSPSGAADLPLS